MEEIVEKTIVGTAGFISSVTLANINAFLSAVVAIMTIVYLGISISKKLKEK